MGAIFKLYGFMALACVVLGIVLDFGFRMDPDGGSFVVISLSLFGLAVIFYIIRTITGIRSAYDARLAREAQEEAKKTHEKVISLNMTE